MKTLFAALLITSLAIGAVLAQATSFPPRVGETWRVDVDGLSPTTLKFTAPSNANPGAVNGTAEMAGFAGKSRSVASQGQYLILWTAKEGTYYCVFAGQPTITGSTVKGLGAAVERTGGKLEDLNKGCSATRIGVNASSSTASSTATVPASAAKPDAPLPMPAASPAPQNLEPGQVWHVSLAPNADVYRFQVIKPALTVPSSLGNASGWFEASVDILQRVTTFAFAAYASSNLNGYTRSLNGYVRLNAGALQLIMFDYNNSVLSCEFAAVQLRGNRYIQGKLRPSDAARPLTCNAQWGGTWGFLPVEAATTLENMRRALGSSAAWNGLKTVSIRTQLQGGDVPRQTVTIVDFIGKRFYREFYQGSGSQQVITAKEWQLSDLGAQISGRFRLEVGSGVGVQRVRNDTPDLSAALYTDFWALRYGASGWNSASLEPQSDGTQVLTVERMRHYTRYLVRDGKYAGRLIQNPVSAISGILSATPERFADAGGILAPVGKTTYTALIGQSFSPDFVDTVLRVALNPELPAGLFEIK